VVVSIPFAIIGIKINPNPLGNPVGIEANVAFFGFLLILFALFNSIFLPIFYQTAQKVGKALLFGSIAVTIYILALEVAVQKVPFLKTWLDTSDSASMLSQLPILISGIVIFALSLWFTYKRSAANFEKVDL